ncbi:hypothetical protein JHK85_008299 [Glycine max]|nr:hypothetical protein JHK85_008299 [Glycine max]KAG5072848.1 hypothetical protein JHK86_008059 [Glycine max]
MALDDYCTLCNAYPETLSHALGDCTWVRGAWNNLGINDTWNFFQHNVHRSLVHDNSARDEFIKALQLHASLESMLHEYPAEDLAAFWKARLGGIVTHSHIETETKNLAVDDNTMRSFRMRNLLSSVKKKTIENRNKTSRNCISITKELARLVEEEEEEEVNEEGFNIKSSAPSHTHGVQPLGNLYLNTGSTNSRDTGLGNLHTLSDDLVLDILGFLDASSLGILATVSKSFYVFTNHEPLLEESRCIDNWGALRNWDRDYLVRLCGDVKFSVGSLEMKLGEYFGYSGQVREERPLYLFDPKFAEKVSKLGDDYDVPVYFREDLFGVLGNERPDYRWVIIGPSGSGSSFHVDPNSASAWNAVIKGSKKWILFPPDVIPPGVHPSPDGADAASPVSIIEWFMNFYGATKNWQKKPIECVCKAGEVIFVPCGWWHLVINLEESIAITQNYVSKRNLMNVLDFLKRPNATLVSGTRDRVNLYDKFKNAIEASFPGEIDELTRKEEERKIQQRKLSFWDTDADTYSGAFKFSF